MLLICIRVALHFHQIFKLNNLLIPTVIVARQPSGQATVCKTVIRRFESGSGLVFCIFSQAKRSPGPNSTLSLSKGSNPARALLRLAMLAQHEHQLIKFLALSESKGRFFPHVGRFPSSKSSTDLHIIHRSNLGVFGNFSVTHFSLHCTPLSEGGLRRRHLPGSHPKLVGDDS